MAAETQIQKNLQFGGFYNSNMLGQDGDDEKLEIQSLKGEAEDNFDFPLQLDFLNS